MAGRKPKTFSAEQFEKLCNIQATLEEITSWFDVSKDTIRRRCKETFNLNFEDSYKKFSNNGKMSVRRMQMKLALDGNVTMLIWLGKQVLGQADKREQKIEFEGDVNFSTKAKEHNALINRRFNIPV